MIVVIVVYANIIVETNRVQKDERQQEKKQELGDPINRLSSYLRHCVYYLSKNESI